MSFEFNLKCLDHTFLKTFLKSLPRQFQTGKMRLFFKKKYFQNDFLKRKSHCGKVIGTLLNV